MNYEYESVFYCPAHDFSCPYIRADGECVCENPQEECDECWEDE